MKQTIKRQLIATILILSMTLALCACQSPGSAKMPADNDSCNNGFFAIMETESGYYMNYWGTQKLRYYDKESGNEIYLCPKPECAHDGGESCTATYRNMRVVNSVLYDGAIYILSTEEKGETAGYYLYRAALDGSSLDKIGCAFSAENTIGEETFWSSENNFESWLPTFIIHRGYAYIPFFMAFKHSIMGFVNGGIIKMDITNGKSEQIYAMSDFHDSCPQKLRAYGKYVFFDLMGTRSDKPRGTLCYDSESGEVICPFGAEYADSHFLSVAESEELIYMYGFTADTLIPYKIGGEQEETEEHLSEQQIVLDGIPTGIFASMITVKLYENRFFVFTENQIFICDINGNKLGELPNPSDDDYTYPQRPEFQITNGKLYAVCQPALPFHTVGLEPPTAAAIAYSCPIEDILAGNGSWTPAYTISTEWLPCYGTDIIDDWTGHMYHFKF